MFTSEYLVKYIDAAISKIEYPQEPKGLYDPIKYTLDCGGKRLRPLLTLATCDVLGGDIAVAKNQAIGIEIFHNFTLLHDDVMDNADMRRGKATVHRKWNDATAILSGDAMLTLASQFMAKGDVSKIWDVLTLFNTTAMENYIKELNTQQQEAVLYLDGPQLVIAGAGSGKTRVLTYKIVHLISHDYEPWRILALTFTNKAAREMRERIECLVGGATASKLWMGTFHSIFARILRINAERLGFKSDFTIYDSSDSKSLIKSIIKDLDLDDKIYKPSTIMSAISMAKNALISPVAYAQNRLKRY